MVVSTTISPYRLLIVLNAYQISWARKRYVTYSIYNHGTRDGIN